LTTRWKTELVNHRRQTDDREKELAYEWEKERFQEIDVQTHHQSVVENVTLLVARVAEPMLTQ